jgi:hypothetical protein
VVDNWSELRVGMAGNSDEQSERVKRKDGWAGTIGIGLEIGNSGRRSE